VNRRCDTGKERNGGENSHEVSVHKSNLGIKQLAKLFNTLVVRDRISGGAGCLICD
jgi:hypothetical protein